MVEHSAGVPVPQQGYDRKAAYLGLAVGGGSRFRHVAGQATVAQDVDSGDNSGFEGLVVHRTPAVLIGQSVVDGQTACLLERDDVGHVNLEFARFGLQGHAFGVDTDDQAARGDRDVFYHAGIKRFPGLLE